MRKTLFFLFTSFVSALPPYQSPARLSYEQAPYNDEVIECGVLFSLLALSLKDAGETVRSKTYAERYKRNLKVTETEFLKNGRTVQEAQDVYKERRIRQAGVGANNTVIGVLPPHCPLSLDL